MSKGPLLDFSDPSLLSVFNAKKKLTSVVGNRRPSGTIEGSVRHSIVHTSSPNASLHHTIMAYSPHPSKALAETGESYMIAYVSIPIDWLDLIDRQFANEWNVSFAGPAGMIQKLPPALKDIEDILARRVYIGFDWLRIGAVEPIEQPSYEQTKQMLIDFVNVLRHRIEYSPSK